MPFRLPRVPVDKATFTVALLTLLVSIYFGLRPREPIRTPLNPDELYRDGEEVGRVQGFQVQQALSGQFMFRVELTRPINVGDVLDYRVSSCLVILEAPVSAVGAFGDESAHLEEVYCRVLGLRS